VHNASAGNIPCATPTTASSPTVATTPAATNGRNVRLIFRYTSDSKSDPLGQSDTFKIRGPFTLWARVWAIAPTKVASTSGVTIFSKLSSWGTSIDRTFAIDIRGVPITGSRRYTEYQCQFGCWIDVMGADNLRWDVRVEQ
jgi:hypothetical protein